MKLMRTGILSSCTLLSAAISIPSMAADSLTEALTSGKTYLDARLRYEAVDQDNALDDAKALTLRTRLGYKTGSFNGFSGLVEFEDSRIVSGQDDFSVPPSGFNSGEFSVIADPETTELDQAFIQYKNDLFTAKYGAQVITLDNHRFVGHVGWRQDRQTFDALSVKFTPTKDLNISLINISERNRIFAEDADQNSDDNLFNLSYKTSVGKLSAYAYLLENEFGTNATLDTYGARFSGSSKLASSKLLYTVEYATQDFEDDSGADLSADYGLFEIGAVVNGFTIKLGYESLGSDDGDFGFSTPLATLHKFNGWADLFLGTPDAGLKDFYISGSTKLGPGKLTIVYHDFSADESTATLDDYGSEIDIAYGMKFGKNYNAGIKYADYSADDFAVDTEKLAVWVGAKF